MSYITRTGAILLNPSEKGRKFSSEMRTGCALTNDFRRKKDKNGRNIKLTKVQRAYRAGYLDHEKDSNRAFVAKHPNYKRKTNLSKGR